MCSKSHLPFCAFHIMYMKKIAYLTRHGPLAKKHLTQPNSIPVINRAVSSSPKFVTNQDKELLQK